MKYEKYEDLVISSDFLEYSFVSTGPKGDIRKIVQFEYIKDIDSYNLSFCDVKANGTLDDLVVSDNKDRNKILATVADAVTMFCEKHPNAWIYFTGSTAERTRLYKIAIALNIEELMIDFEILGVLHGMQCFVSMPFQKGINYFGIFNTEKKCLIL
jgi:hypothetical protein